MGLHPADSRKLREAVADGPVLLGRIEHVHEYVLGADPRIFAEQLRNLPVQCLLLLRGVRAA